MDLLLKLVNGLSFLSSELVIVDIIVGEIMLIFGLYLFNYRVVMGFLNMVLKVEI